jgi:hypothetical protein
MPESGNVEELWLELIQVTLCNTLNAPLITLFTRPLTVFITSRIKFTYLEHPSEPSFFRLLLSLAECHVASRLRLTVVTHAGRVRFKPWASVAWMVGCRV